MRLGKSLAQDLKNTRQRQRQQQTNLSQEVSVYPVFKKKINQPWLTMQVMTTMWSTGWDQQSWTGKMIGAPGGSRRRYISERRNGVQWIEMRAATRWATHMYHHYHGKNRKKNWTGFFWRSSLDRDQNIEVKICQVEIWINVYIIAQHSL